jgi:restriction system protein
MMNYLSPLLGVFQRSPVLIIGVLAAVIVVYSVYRNVRGNKHRRTIQRSKRRLKTVERLHRPEAIIGYLKSMNPYEFEELLLTALKKQGFWIKRNVRYSGDGGIDGRYKSRLLSRWQFVQAKRYRNAVSRADIVQFEAVCRKKRTRGIFVHTGRTPNIKGQTLHRVTIISGTSLVSLIKGNLNEVM